MSPLGQPVGDIASSICNPDPGTLGHKLAGELTVAGHQAVFLETDVSQAQQIDLAVAEVARRLGSVDCLFNHAGTLIVKPFLETTEAEWDWLMAVNVKSMFLVTRAVLPMMLAKGKGAIVSTASISSVTATPMEVLYCATKGACLQFARALAVEYRDRGIRSNAVCPGFIHTDHGVREVNELTRLGVDASESAMKAMQGRMCEPEEVALAALFWLSDEASFINGSAVYVDNGFTAI
jgi:NAD(P)-dependent dehydrogenase (short-subunit alcohol dehydrogenase family)